mmetsp:Transcript_59239/g.123732  ORF Transcript_59239/g.123732 Transcript_59239/m.123732 type:complete len:320 (+) Transcript_59239:1247-2206(+)
MHPAGLALRRAVARQDRRRRDELGVEVGGVLVVEDEGDRGVLRPLGGVRGVEDLVDAHADVAEEGVGVAAEGRDGEVLRLGQRQPHLAGRRVEDARARGDELRQPHEQVQLLLHPDRPGEGRPHGPQLVAVEQQPGSRDDGALAGGGRQLHHRRYRHVRKLSEDRVRLAQRVRARGVARRGRGGKAGDDVILAHKVLEAARRRRLGRQIGDFAWKLVEEVALVEGLGVDPVGVRLHPWQVQGDLRAWRGFGVCNVNDPAPVGKTGHVEVSLEYLHATRTQGVRICGRGLNDAGLVSTRKARIAYPGAVFGACSRGNCVA